METPADKVVQLLLYARKVLGGAEGAFGLKERLLFCLRTAPRSPRDLTESLTMVKSNLALLANACLRDGLIEKRKSGADKRTLVYALTDAGRAYIDERLRAVDEKFATVLTDEKEEASAVKTLDDAVSLLSFVP